MPDIASGLHLGAEGDFSKKFGSKFFLTNEDGVKSLNKDSSNKNFGIYLAARPYVESEVKSLLDKIMSQDSKIRTLEKRLKELEKICRKRPK